MKWKNKGHEFDALAEVIVKLDAIYLFGAGEHGKAAFEKYNKKILIKGFIDNDATKTSENFCGVKVYAPDDIKLLAGEAIVITMQPSLVSTVFKQMEQLGYFKNINIYALQQFFPILDMYKFGEVCLSSISFLPTTVCNLKCKKCLNFAPYIRKQEFRLINDLEADLALLFSKIDTLLLLHLSGGEPLLYPDLAELIAFIAQNFKQKLGRLEMTTNGTVVPSDALCESMARNNLHIIVDDYREQLPQYQVKFSELIKKLEKYGVVYKVLKADAWLDLAPFETDHSDFSENQLVNYFDACAVPWQEYRDGRLWLCNYAAYAEVAGIENTTSNEYFEICKLNDSNRHEFMEFRLGYSEKGYVGFCKRCRSFGNNNIKIKVAEQL